MPLVRGSGRSDCISKNTKIEIDHGKKKNQAVAIAISHCNKIYGVKKNELGSDIDALKEELYKEIDELYDMQNVLEALKTLLRFTGVIKDDREKLSY